MKYQITNQRELRRLFWLEHPDIAPAFRRNKRQNAYCTDTRAAWCDYIERMARDGRISERLAQRATL